MNSSKYVSCRVEPINKDDLLETVELEHGKVVNMGRSPNTQVRDVSVSRLQVSLIADFSKGEVSVTRVGRPPSYLDSVYLEKDVVYTGKNNSILELVENCHQYRIRFHEETISPDDQDSGKCPNTSKTTIMTPGLCSQSNSSVSNDSSIKLTDELVWYDTNNSMLVGSYGSAMDLIKTGISKNEVFKVAGFDLDFTLIHTATNHDYYRKPAPGMWFYLTDKILEGASCCMEKSFYVGDAAGRIKGWKPGKTKDFSISDRLFARNIKLTFLTPEEYFLNERPGRFQEPEFHPWDFPSDLPEVERLINETSSRSEVIVLVGLPASGKTTFAKTYLLPKGYVHVNADTLGSSAKCLKVLSESLNSGKRVVVDNTNLDVATRKKILDICKQVNVSARCFVIDSSFDRCMHNNMFRILKKTDHAVISPMVMKTSRAKFIPPSEVEGFSAIIKVPFIPSFTSDEDKTMYNYYLQVSRTK